MDSVIAQILEAIINQDTFEGEATSVIALILLSILNATPYEGEANSVLAQLFLRLKAKIEGDTVEEFDGEPTGAIGKIILSILNDTEYNEPPTSRIGELLLELKGELETYTELTVSGAIATFTTNVAKPLVDLKAYFSATQESGTPTPTTPLAITGVNEIDITDNNNTLSVALGDTYYGGYLSQDKNGKRQLKIDFVKLDLKDIPNNSWSLYSGMWLSEYTQATIKKVGSNSEIGNIKSNAFKTVNRSNVSSQENAIAINTNGTTYIHSTDLASLTKEEFLEAIADFYIVYELANPFTVDLEDGDPIITVIGENNIFNSCDNTEVTYLYKGN